MPLREDQEALESRRDVLREKLAEATRRAEALRVASPDRAALERELADLDARLAQKKNRRLSLLDGLRIASPCNASWDAMTGDDRVRFCGECQKNVYNLSAMTREEAEALLAEREETPCVRFYQRADGTVITSDCPVGVRRRRRRNVLAAAGTSALAAVSTLAISVLDQRGKPAGPELSAVASQGVTVPPEAITTVEPPPPPAEQTPPHFLMGRPASHVVMGAPPPRPPTTPPKHVFRSSP
jgi:hypothetical protein